MADTKISALGAASALVGTEPFPTVQAATTVQATATQLKTYALTSPSITGNASVAGNLTVGSGATGLVMQPYTAGGYGALYSTAVTPGNGNFAFVTTGVNTYLNGTGTSALWVNGANVLTATSTGAAVTGTLSSTGALSVPNGTSAANAIQFGGSATTGFYSTGAGIVRTPAQLISDGGFNGSYTSYSFYNVNGVRVLSATAPTIASGFGTSPSITASAGTAAFKVTVGTGGAASGVLTFPAATTGWAVNCTDVTNRVTIVAVAVSTSTTSVTVEAYSRTTGLASTFVAGDVLEFSALGY